MKKKSIAAASAGLAMVATLAGSAAAFAGGGGPAQVRIHTGEPSAAVTVCFQAPHPDSSFSLDKVPGLDAEFDNTTWESRLKSQVNRNTRAGLPLEPRFDADLLGATGAYCYDAQSNANGVVDLPPLRTMTLHIEARGETIADLQQTGAASWSTGDVRWQQANTAWVIRL